MQSQKSVSCSRDLLSPYIHSCKTGVFIFILTRKPHLCVDCIPQCSPNDIYITSILLPRLGRTGQTLICLSQDHTFVQLSDRFRYRSLIPFTFIEHLLFRLPYIFFCMPHYLMGNIYATLNGSYKQYVSGLQLKSILVSPSVLKICASISVNLLSMPPETIYRIFLKFPL